MNTLLLLPLLLCNPGEATTAEVRIESRVEGTSYSWTVHNRSATSITRFEIQQYHGFNHTAPPGWSCQVQAEQFVATAQDPDSAIPPGQSGEFGLMVSSAGAKLSQVDARVDLSSGQMIVLSDAWAPTSERPLSLLIAGSLAGLFLAHFLVLNYRDRLAASHSDSTDGIRGR
jgi:hypothetical protein